MATLKLKLRPEVLVRVVWGLPDVPVRHLCGICHGALPEAPLMLWRSDGSGASFCDVCAELLISAEALIKTGEGNSQ